MAADPAFQSDAFQTDAYQAFTYSTGPAPDWRKYIVAASDRTYVVPLREEYDVPARDDEFDITE